MTGTFRAGDCLCLTPLPFEQLRRGDVVVFRPEGSPAEYVHRVIALTPRGPVTQGDYSPTPDPHPLVASRYLGVVTHVVRANRRHTVARGWGGILQARIARTSRLAIRLLALLLGAPYHGIRACGLFRSRPPLSLARIRLPTREGIVVKYVWRGQTVGRWWPGSNRWECRKPFDLFLAPPLAAGLKPASRELELLLHCIRPAATTPAAEQLREVDWQAFIQLARNHHIVPLVHRALLQAAQGEGQAALIPGSIIAEFKRLQYMISAFNMMVSTELTDLMGRCTTAGVSAIPVKGPVLALLAYGSTSMRQYEDLDFAVPPAHIIPLRDLLVRRGYTLVRAPDEPHQKAYIRSLQDWIFLHAERPLNLDVKPVLLSHLTSRPSDILWLQESLQPIGVDRHEVMAPGRTAMLILACMHGTSNAWAKASLLADVAALAHQLTANEWAELLCQADRIRKRRDVLIGLALAHELLGVALPEGIRKDLAKERHLRQLVADASRHLRHPEAHASELEILSFQRRSRDTVADACRCVIRYLTIPSHIEWTRFRLPPALTFAYVLIRPARLAREWLRASPSH